MSLLHRLDHSRYGDLPVRPVVQSTSDAKGFEHHVARWPLRPEHPANLLRPSILGGGFDHVHLPDPDEVRAALPCLGMSEVPEGRSPLVFLDTETTGLMGSGAFVFVLGIAYSEGGELVVEQWTLRLVMAEDRMLSAALARIAELGGALATYNGSSFDLPLLRRRARRNGLASEVLDGPHLDLLHVARRMWKGLHEDCRLVTLEQTRLGVHRVGDLPGDMIPATFWEALRNPDDPRSELRLACVRMHNHADVVALAALIPELQRAVQDPERPLSAVRSARHLSTIGDVEGALDRLSPWVRECQAGCEPTPALHPLCNLAAELLRRLGRHDEAAVLWHWLCTHFVGDPEASDGLAKHLEHRVRDLSAALEVATASTQPCARRIGRLRRKLGYFEEL